MDRELLILGGFILLVVIIVISLIKKAVKFAFSIIAIIIIFSLIRIVVYGVSPMEELNAYKINIQYGKDIAQYTSKIKSSADEIKDIISNRNFDEKSLNKLKEENDKLTTYQKEVRELKHTKKLDFFHERYSEYLNTIVSASNTSATLVRAGDKTFQGAEELINKLKVELDKLTGLQLK